MLETLASWVSGSRALLRGCQDRLLPGAASWVSGSLGVWIPGCLDPFWIPCLAHCCESPIAENCQEGSISSILSETADRERQGLCNQRQRKVTRKGGFQFSDGQPNADSVPGLGFVGFESNALNIRRGWFEDGPLLPIEFARKSNDNRVTLVLQENAPVVRSLWALMSVTTLDDARKSLTLREGLTGATAPKNIGYWSTSNGSDKGNGVDIIAQVSQWASSLHLDAVIWTGLKPNFTSVRYDDGLTLEVIKHIANMTPEERRNAELYVRSTPMQIDTNVRRQIEKEFGWFPSQ